MLLGALEKQSGLLLESLSSFWEREMDRHEYDLWFNDTGLCFDALGFRLDANMTSRGPSDEFKTSATGNW